VQACASTGLHKQAGVLDQLKAIGRTLKHELKVYQLVLKDPRTPKLAKWLLGLAVGYTLLPFDLIPDFIPIIGHLDDVNHHAIVAAMNPARRQATYEDLLKVPDHLIAEIIDGELFTFPRPSIPHSHATSILNQDLGPFSRRTGGPGGSGGWWILFEPELHLGSDIIVPDLAGWRRERMPTLRDVPYVEQAPDWACEILSQSTVRVDRIRKMRIYAREHVSHVWLADPLARTLEVYRLGEQRWILVGTYDGEEPVRAEPFDAIELDINRWWLEETEEGKREP